MGLFLKLCRYPNTCSKWLTQPFQLFTNVQIFLEKPSPCKLIKHIANTNCNQQELPGEEQDRAGPGVRGHRLLRLNGRNVCRAEKEKIRMLDWWWIPRNLRVFWWQLGTCTFTICSSGNYHHHGNIRPKSQSEIFHRSGTQKMQDQGYGFFSEQNSTQTDDSVW